MTIAPSAYFAPQDKSLVDLTFNLIDGPELVRLSQEFEHRVRTVTCCALYNATQKHMETFFKNTGTSLMQLTLSTIHQPWIDLRSVHLPTTAPLLKRLHVQKTILHASLFNHPKLEHLKLSQCHITDAPQRVLFGPSLESVELVTSSIQAEHLHTCAPSKLSTLYVHAPPTPQPSSFKTALFENCPITMIALDAPTLQRVSFRGDMRYLYYARLGESLHPRSVHLHDAINLHPFVARQLRASTLHKRIP